MLMLHFLKIFKLNYLTKSKYNTKHINFKL